MIILNSLNLDLISVGIATAGIGILGFVVFFSNTRSSTNRVFLMLSLVTIFWGLNNYLSYQTNLDYYIAFWFLKITIFFATLQAFFLFNFLYVFPDEKTDYPKYFKFGIVPITALTAVITLTPLAFKRIIELSSEGRIIKLENGPGMILFGFVVLTFVIAGMVILLKKTVKAEGIEKKQFKTVFMGLAITFTLLIIFNFIFPVFLNNPNWIPFGSVFIFPLIVFTSYAIFKHHLLNIKIIATEVLTFLLAISTLSQVILAKSILASTINFLVFAMILIFGILLIKSVRKEVEQREKLEKLTLELEDKNEKLQKLDKLKSEFLSFAAHQVKSPMAVVKGYSDLILGGNVGEANAQIKDIAQKIKNSAARLISLVNNLLDMRKLDEGRMEYSFEKVNVAELIKNLVNEMSPLAKDKNLELSFSAEITDVEAAVDVLKFTQVIQNIVDNAIKYTKAGWVKVSIEKENENALIVISDSGGGIPKDVIGKIFEQFERGAFKDKAIQGTGLGLYIAKQIVLAHKGEIWAESEGDGKGSKFFVKIPASNE